MPIYEIDVVELASGVYTVEAESPVAAVNRLTDGSWDAWKDLGHDSPEITAVREVEA